MALTKISTDGVKDDAITKAKIPANQIEASELADNAVDTNAIADQAVTLDKLPHGDTNNDGKFLRANNGADPSYEAIAQPDLTNLSASNLTSGTVPDARFPATLPAVSGANLTNLPPGAVTNLIQNGNMAVHQRWGGSADTTNGWASADRFRLEYVNTVNSVSQNIVRLSSSSGNADDPFDVGIKNIFQITNGNQTSTATNAMVSMAYGALARDLLHSGWDHTSSSSYLTLSYYVRSSVAGTFYGRVYTPLGGGKHFAWSTGALTANTWKRVTVQIPGDSSFDIALNSSADLTSFLFYFGCYAGTSTTDSSSPTTAWGAVSGSNQYPDYASDKKVGKNHLVVLLGKKASRWIYGLNLILTLGSLYFIAENILIGTKQMLFLYLLIPIAMFYSYFLLSGLFKYYNSRKLIKYNIHTIYFHMLFSFIYMIILANF